MRYGGHLAIIKPAPKQVNSDWSATEGVAMILNKPTIPDAETFVVHINFKVVEAETYICPYNLKFTAMKHSQTNAPTLSVALDTNMAEYDELVITPDEIGLVTLTGIWL